MLIALVVSGVGFLVVAVVFEGAYQTLRTKMAVSLEEAPMVLALVVCAGCLVVCRRSCRWADADGYHLLYCLQSCQTLRGEGGFYLTGGGR